MPILALAKNTIMQAATQAALATFAALLLSLFVITTTGCKKPTDNPPTVNNTSPTPCDTCLPPIATEGNSMFGCRVNGKVWLPKDSWMNPMLTLVLYHPDKINLIGVIARNYNDNSNLQDVSFSVSPINDTGVVYFPNNKLLHAKANFYYNKSEYYSEPIQKGFIHFSRVDRINGSVAGTFEFDVYSRDRQDTIHITDGRFLIHK